jgi:two-component system, chemotaxis family, chemotaxis protein CheY
MNKYKILIVDDSSVMRQGIMGIINEHLNVEFKEAGDGEQAIEQYKDYQPDLVTLDINMPKMDGIEALINILDFDSSAKVIMLTTESDKSKIIEAVSRGAKSYIVKPIDKDKAIMKIKSALSL